MCLDTLAYLTSSSFYTEQCNESSSSGTRTQSPFQSRFLSLKAWTEVDTGLRLKADAWTHAWKLEYRGLVIYNALECIGRVSRLQRIFDCHGCSSEYQSGRSGTWWGNHFRQTGWVVYSSRYRKMWPLYGLKAGRGSSLLLERWQQLAKSGRV